MKTELQVGDVLLGKFGTGIVIFAAVSYCGASYKIHWVHGKEKSYTTFINDSMLTQHFWERWKLIRS